MSRPCWYFCIVRATISGGSFGAGGVFVPGEPVLGGGGAAPAPVAVSGAGGPGGGDRGDPDGEGDGYAQH